MATAARKASHYERTGKLQRKIDVYVRPTRGRGRHAVGKYLGSTNHHRTCREAVEAIAASTGYAASDLVAYFAR